MIHFNGIYRAFLRNDGIAPISPGYKLVLFILSIEAFITREMIRTHSVWNDFDKILKETSGFIYDYLNGERDEINY